MIKVDTDRVIEYFNHNLILLFSGLGFAVFAFVVSMVPALFVMSILTLSLGTAILCLLTLLVRAIKSRDEFNAYDFFRIPRPEERGTPKAGATTLREVKTDEESATE